LKPEWWGSPVVQENDDDGGGGGDDDDDDNNNNNNNNNIGRPNRNSAHMECESKSDTTNNRGYWNHFQIAQTVPEQYTRKA
jgi:hypothetical protein